MVDIVERLRDYCPASQDWISTEADALTDEAADEIERLRAALKPFADRAESVDHLEPEDGIWAASFSMLTIQAKHLFNARAALSGEKSDEG